MNQAVPAGEAVLHHQSTFTTRQPSNGSFYQWAKHRGEGCRHKTSDSPTRVPWWARVVFGPRDSSHPCRLPYPLRTAKGAALLGNSQRANVTPLPWQKPASPPPPPSQQLPSRGGGQFVVFATPHPPPPSPLAPPRTPHESAILPPEVPLAGIVFNLHATWSAYDEPTAARITTPSLDNRLFHIAAALLPQDCLAHSSLFLSRPPQVLPWWVAASPTLSLRGRLGALLGTPPLSGCGSVSGGASRAAARPGAPLGRIASGTRQAVVRSYISNE